MTCTEARLSLGAYVVGALDDTERAELRSHLDGCCGCREELRELADVAPLLATMTLAEAESGPADPGEELLERLLTRAAREQRAARRRRAVLALAAVVVVLAMVGGVVALLVGRTGPTRPATVAAPVVTVSASSTTSGAHAAVAVTSVAWGSRLELELDGVPAGERCQLVAVGRSGTREVAATWQVPAGGYRSSGGNQLHLQGAVSLWPDQIDRFDVVTLDGRTLVSVPA